MNKLPEIVQTVNYQQLITIKYYQRENRQNTPRRHLTEKKGKRREQCATTFRAIYFDFTKIRKKNPLHITKDFFKLLNTTMKLYFNVLGKKRKSG